jgi:hypothetical protein
LKREREREREREILTGLDGSKMDAILIVSSRSKGLDCIFVVSKYQLPSTEAKQ